MYRDGFRLCKFKETLTRYLNLNGSKLVDLPVVNTVLRDSIHAFCNTCSLPGEASHSTSAWSGVLNTAIY